MEAEISEMLEAKKIY